MGDVVSLKQFRRRREQEEKERAASANRRKHGRTKAERTRDDAERQQGEEQLEGHRLEKEDGVDDLPPGKGIHPDEKAARGRVLLQAALSLLMVRGRFYSITFGQLSSALAMLPGMSSLQRC